MTKESKASQTAEEKADQQAILNERSTRRATLEDLIAIAMCVPLGDDVRDKDCPWGLPLYLEGQPGIGKTSRVEAAAHRLGLGHVAVVYAPTKTAEDFNGLRVPAGNGKTEVVPMLLEVEPLLSASSGLLFLDELSSASAGTQAGALGTILGGWIAGRKLGPKIRRIAAGNPISSAAGGWGLEPPTANRFCHLSVPEPKADEWLRWLMRAEVAAEPLEVREAKVLENWDLAWQLVVSQVTGFLKSKAENMLFQMPAIGNESRGHAWASNRTWFFALRAAATCRALGAGFDAEATLIEGCLGESVAGQLLQYMRKLDLPQPRDVLDGKWKPAGKKLDVKVAAYTNATLSVANRKEELAKHAPHFRGTDYELLLTRLYEFYEEGASDFVAVCLDSLRPIGDPSRNPAGVKLLRQYSKDAITTQLNAGSKLWRTGQRCSPSPGGGPSSARSTSTSSAPSRA